MQNLLVQESAPPASGRFRSQQTRPILNRPPSSRLKLRTCRPCGGFRRLRPSAGERRGIEHQIFVSESVMPNYRYGMIWSSGVTMRQVRPFSP